MSTVVARVIILFLALFFYDRNLNVINIIVAEDFFFVYHSIGVLTNIYL